MLCFVAESSALWTFAPAILSFMSSGVTIGAVSFLLDGCHFAVILIAVPCVPDGALLSSSSCLEFLGLLLLRAPWLLLPFAGLLPLQKGVSPIHLLSSTLAQLH